MKRLLGDGERRGACRTTMAIACVAILQAQAALAAPTRPWPQETCEALAKKIFDVTRIPIKTADGAISTVWDRDPPGKACVLSGTTTGLKVTFAEVEKRVQKMLDGWVQIPEIAAGGPDSSVQGYKKNDQRLIVDLQVEPPHGTCDNVAPDDCKVPKKRWQWTFKAAAYSE